MIDQRRLEIEQARALDRTRAAANQIQRILIRFLIIVVAINCANQLINLAVKLGQL